LELYIGSKNLDSLCSRSIVRRDTVVAMIVVVVVVVAVEIAAATDDIAVAVAVVVTVDTVVVAPVADTVLDSLRLPLLVFRLNHLARDVDVLP
jgi:hypothetical protein